MAQKLSRTFLILFTLVAMVLLVMQLKQNSDAELAKMRYNSEIIKLHQKVDSISKDSDDMRQELRMLRGEEPSRGAQRIVTRTMEITAYTAGPESTGKSPGHPAYGLTASGYTLKAGDKVIAAPPDIPFGTRIEIPGYGIAVVRDRGGDIQGSRLDIYMDDLNKALAWGRRTVQVKIYY